MWRSEPVSDRVPAAHGARPTAFAPRLLGALLLLSGCSGSPPAAPVAGLDAGFDEGVPLDLALPPPDLTASPLVPVEGSAQVLTRTLYLGERQVVLYQPAFAFDRGQAYLLFINDGQDMGKLGLAATLDAMWKSHGLPPLVVAALPVSPGGDRLQDYGTAEHDASIPCDTGDGGTPLLGTRAGAYGLYVVRQVVPAVLDLTGITPTVAHTGFLGASLGGLSAVSIAWDHPERFGFAGAMSGSFWWRSQSGTVQQRNDSRIQQAIVRRSAPHPGFGAWFEAGTDDETADRDGNGVIDAIDDTLALMAALRTVGLGDGPDLVYRQVQGGIHDYVTWASVLPEFLAWAAAR